MIDLRSRFQLGFAPLFLAAFVLMSPIAAHGDARKTFRAARLTYLEGEVHVSQASSNSRDTAILNMPLTEGSVISTGDDGQAEVEFEDGSLVRITPNSGVSLLNLSVDGSGDYQTRVALTGGLTYLELRAGTKYQYSIDAGGDVITPIENAIIRVDLDEPPAAIAVLDGSAHIASAKGSADVDANAGQTVTMTGTEGGGTYLMKAEITTESWDQWNEERDSAAASEAGSETAARSKFAGDQGYGWSDLDANGSWYDVPGQGEVWQPDVAAQEDGESADSGSGFDPYSYGGWAWTPAGYTWASGYGWGWLPYRCGQWSYWDGFGWGWTPGVACGSFGFGGFGYGGISIGRAPGFYRRPHRPLPGPSPIHPILRGPGGPQPLNVSRNVRPGSGSSFARQIGGHFVEPLQPVGGTSYRGGPTLGAGLRRDFPVNRTTHEPISGVVAYNPAPVVLSNGRLSPPAGSGAARPRPAPVAPAEGYAPQRAYQRPYQGSTTPAPSYRPSPAQQPMSRPAPSYSPAPRSAPSFSPAPRSAPAPAPASRPAPAASPHSK